SPGRHAAPPGRRRGVLPPCAGTRPVTSVHTAIVGARMIEAIVVGGGVVGAAASRALAVAGVKVTLLDAQRIGAGTSRATFAWLNANAKRPREYFELNLAGMRAHESFAAAHPDAPWLHHGGNVEWV